MVVIHRRPISIKDYMAKKTYRTFFLKGYHLLLNTSDGARVEIKFRTGIQIDSTAKYTTSNEEIQALLENTSGFGRDYYLESSVEVEADSPAPEKKVEAKQEPKKEIMTEVKGSERFKNLVEMKNRMAELGIELDEDANYQKAKATAAKEGYDFQIQKK